MIDISRNSDFYFILNHFLFRYKLGLILLLADKQWRRHLASIDLNPISVNSGLIRSKIAIFEQNKTSALEQLFDIVTVRHSWKIMKRCLDRFSSIFETIIFLFISLCACQKFKKFENFHFRGLYTQIQTDTFYVT